MNPKTYLQFYNHKRKLKQSSRNRIPIMSLNKNLFWTCVAFLAFATMTICGSLAYLDWRYTKSDSSGRIADLERKECVCEKCGGGE